MSIKMLFDGFESKYKRAAFLSPVAMLGEVGMEVAIPLVISKIIDVGIANADVAYTAKTGALMIFMAILSLACGSLSARFAAVGALGFAKNIRRKLFSKIQDFTFANIDDFSTSSLVTRLTTDVTNVQNLFMMLVRTCVRSPVMLISSAAMSLYLNARLAIIFLIAAPILAACLALIGTKSYPLFKKMFEKYDALNGSVQENLIGIRVVKSFVRADYENARFKKSADDVRKAQVAAEKIIILNMPIMQAIMYICNIAILWFGARFIVEQKMQTGELISFITYSTQILSSLMMLSMIFITMIISRASIQRITDVLETKSDITSPANPFVPKNLGALDIDFEDVSFSYLNREDNKVLSGATFHIPAGTTVGILGGTGSSKTTLVQLIPRLYDAFSGSVKVGGVDVKDWDLEKLRTQVAMVLQNNVLFSGTIKENLKWGNENATDEEIVEACKAACADEFINGFPEKYETELGQGGVNVSGGQKQRLCIARALLKNPAILILDDSTSAVDTATDFKIRQALRQTLPGATKIIIAQRIASIQDADMIFVMDSGKIVDSGTHEQLLQSSEIYKEVYETQYK